MMGIILKGAGMALGLDGLVDVIDAAGEDGTTFWEGAKVAASSVAVAGAAVGLARATNKAVNGQSNTNPTTTTGTKDPASSNSTTTTGTKDPASSNSTTTTGTNKDPASSNESSTTTGTNKDPASPNDSTTTTGTNKDPASSAVGVAQATKDEGSNNNAVTGQCNAYSTTIASPEDPNTSQVEWFDPNLHQELGMTRVPDKRLTKLNPYITREVVDANSDLTCAGKTVCKLGDLGATEIWKRGDFLKTTKELVTCRGVTIPEGSVCKLITW